MSDHPTVRDARLKDVLRSVLSAAEPGWDVDLDAFLTRNPEVRTRLERLIDAATAFDPGAGLTEPDRNVAPSRLGPGAAPSPEPTAPAITDVDAGPPPTQTGVEAPAGGRHAGDTMAYAMTPAEPVAPQQEPPRVGTRIRYFGDYELLEVLGNGGMGVVYRARQVSLNRPVAIKMLLSGEHATDTELRRFQNEAEAVAQLDHEGIIPILEVGERDGQRYFSMKLIEGTSLDKQLGRFTAHPRRAAEVVARTADAVQHAHERGILHRDLKPGNILIDAQGLPHVGDFGLARRLDVASDLTQSDAVIGTPGYFSPEQASGRRNLVTVSSDVYGLGAVLYALLAGRAPFRGNSIHDTIQLVRESWPEPPSRINTQVDRDLETICLKCLEKEPTRRYPSAAALAADLRNWLDGRPIEARPVGPATRLWLWSRRKPVVAALSAALAASLVLGFAGITWNWLEVRQKRNELAATNVALTRQRDVATALNEFLLDDLIAEAAPERNPRREAITIERALDRASLAVSTRFHDQPAIEAALRLAIGRTYLALGQPAKALPQLAASLDLARRLHGPDSPQALEAALALAITQRELGKSAEAEPLFRDTIPRLQVTLGPTHPETLSGLRGLALALRQLNKLDEAESLLRQTLDTQLRTRGESDLEAARTRNDLAALLEDRGRLDEAVALCRQVVAVRVKALPPDHPAVLMAQGNLGALLARSGSLPEADRILTEILPGCRRVLGDDHVNTLAVLASLGAVDLRARRIDSGEKNLSEALAGQRRVLGQFHPATLVTQGNLALVPVHRDRPAEATAGLREIFAIRRDRQGSDHVDTIRAAINLALNLQDTGQSAEALGLFDRYLPLLRSIAPAGDDTLTAAVLGHGAALVSERAYDRALPLIQEGLEARRRTLPAGSSRIALTESLLGEALAGQGHNAQAEPLLLRAATVVETARDVAPRRAGAALDRLIAFYEKTRQPDQAAAWRERKNKALQPTAPSQPADPSGTKARNSAQ